MRKIIISYPEMIFSAQCTTDFRKRKRFGIFFFANREFKTGVSCMNCKGSKTGCSFYRIRNGKPTFLQSKKKIQEVMDMGEQKVRGR